MGFSEALTIVASFFTIWAQSSVLAENGEFERFKEKEPVVEEQPVDEMEKRRQEILQAGLERRRLILANTQILSQTDLGER